MLYGKPPRGVGEPGVGYSTARRTAGQPSTASMVTAAALGHLGAKRTALQEVTNIDLGLDGLGELSKYSVPEEVEVAVWSSHGRLSVCACTGGQLARQRRNGAVAAWCSGGALVTTGVLVLMVLLGSARTVTGQTAILAVTGVVTSLVALAITAALRGNGKEPDSTMTVRDLEPGQPLAVAVGSYLSCTKVYEQLVPGPLADRARAALVPARRAVYALCEVHNIAQDAVGVASYLAGLGYQDEEQRATSERCFAALQAGAEKMEVIAEHFQDIAATQRELVGSAAILDEAMSKAIVTGPSRESTLAHARDALLSEAAMAVARGA